MRGARGTGEPGADQTLIAGFHLFEFGHQEAGAYGRLFESEGFERLARSGEFAGIDGRPRESKAGFACIRL